MPATDTDPDFYELVVAFSRRRTWPQLLLMVLGGCIALTGIASMASHIVQQDEHLALPMGQAIGLYIAGSAVFAWGAARGDTAALPKWLAITVLSGSLFILFAGIAGLVPAIARGVLDRFVGPREDGGTPTLASMVVDRGEAEALVGSPAESRDIRTPARSVTAVWQGPPREPGTAGGGSMVTVNVRRSTRLATRVRSEDVQPPIMRVPGVGDGCVVVRRGSGAGETVSVQAAQGDWVVAMSLHGHAEFDPTPALLRYVSRALRRLAQTLP